MLQQRSEAVVTAAMAVMVARREVRAAMIAAVMAEAVMRAAEASVMAVAMMMPAILHLGHACADVALHGSRDAGAVQRHRFGALAGSGDEQQSCDCHKAKDLLEVHFRFLIPAS